MAIKRAHLTPQEISLWQNDVLDKDLATAPTSPADNARYIVAGIGGNWSTATINDIAWFLDGGWVFITPVAGMKLYVEDEAIEYKYNGTSWDAENNTLQVTIGEQGVALVTGFAGQIVVPYDCKIISAEITSLLTGSIVIDIWSDSYANYPPTDVDSITASAPLTISTAIKAQDTTLTGWTKTLTQGQRLFLNIDSVSAIETVHFTLFVKRT